MSNIVSIRMKEKTLKLTDKLQESFHSPSKSDVIRRAIEISDVIANTISEGGQVIMEDKNGMKSKVILPGLVIR